MICKNKMSFFFLKMERDVSSWFKHLDLFNASENKNLPWLNGWNYGFVNETELKGLQIDFAVWNKIVLARFEPDSSGNLVEAIFQP